MTIIYCTTNSQANAGQGEFFRSQSAEAVRVCMRASECAWIIPGTYAGE